MIFLIVFISIIFIMMINVVVIIMMKRKKEFREKYYNAASNIIKEDLLNYSIQNNIVHHNVEPNGHRLMVCFKNLTTKGNEAYVFDPAKGVQIGRGKMDSHNNVIYLNDIRVSANHCYIYSDGLGVYMQDSGSTNGTIIKRGFRRFFVGNGEAITLYNNDRLLIGGTCFQLIIFYYDASMM